MLDNKLFEKYNNLQIVKSRKDSERQEYIGKLAEATGRTKKSIYFSFIGMPDSWLKDALEHCLHFQDIKARNYKLKEWLLKSRQNEKE